MATQEQVQQKIEEVEKEIEEVKRTTPNDREMLLALRKYLAELQEEKK